MADQPVLMPFVEPVASVSSTETLLPVSSSVPEAARTTVEVAPVVQQQLAAVAPAAVTDNSPVQTVSESQLTMAAGDPPGLPGRTTAQIVATSVDSKQGPKPDLGGGQGLTSFSRTLAWSCKAGSSGDRR